MRYFPLGRSFAPEHYTQPFAPRYSVPEGFQRALSYEGQQHWLAGIMQRAAEYIEDAHVTWCLQSSTTLTGKASTYLGTDVTFSIARDESTGLHEGHVPAPEVVKEGDLCVIRARTSYYDADSSSYPKSYSTFVGWLVSACRCNSPEEWTVHIVDILPDMEGKVFKLASDVADLKYRITTLETKVTNLTTRVTNVENRVTNVENRVTNLQTTVNNYQNSNKQTLQDIVNKFYGGGTVNADGSVTWNTVGKAGVGNINVFSQVADPATDAQFCIRTREDVGEHDLWFESGA